MIVIAKLDWTITSPEERLKCVEKVLEENPSPNEAYLELMATYLVECVEKKEKEILSDNRLVTINKRETSLEGLYENGEDVFYNLISDNNKNAIFRPKISITRQDLEDIEPLRQKRESINFWESQFKKSTGHNALIIKQTIIELRKDQYIIKDAYRRPAKFATVTRNLGYCIALPSQEWVNESDEVCYSGVSLCDKRIVEQILCNYQSLKSHSHDKLSSDTWHLIQDFDDVYSRALRNYPMCRRVVELKMQLVNNAEIKSIIESEFGISHSIEYYSGLWRKRIPNLIARQAQEDVLVWHHINNVKSRWRRCNRCGQIKLMHNRFFSINNYSKSGFYTICKCCRKHHK